MVERIGDAELHLGDCLEIVPRLVAEGLVVDAIVCDPPYHLAAISERSKYKIKHGKDGAMGRLLKGFMGTTWDGGTISFRPETWATLATALRPGGFLVAFGGTRTYHRMVSAIEDAGLVIQDTILDLIASDTRWERFVSSLDAEQIGALEDCIGDVSFDTFVAWVFGSGFPKRGDMLKPAFEPICVAYKPGGKRALQVEECRIELASDDYLQNGIKSDGHIFQMLYKTTLKAVDRTPGLGRWPANLVHDGSNEVLAAFAKFGEDKPSRASFRGLQNSGRHAGITILGPNIKDGTNNLRGHDDLGGSAARFFYSAKAPPSERENSKHPTQKPVALMQYLVKLFCPPNGLVLDPFAGSGSTGVAARDVGRRFIGIEHEEGYFRTMCFRIEKEDVTIAIPKHQPAEGGLLW